MQIEFPLQQPLLIRLMDDVGKLPGGVTAEVPRNIAYSLIRRRLATPVGDLNAIPDVVITEEDLNDVFDPAMSIVIGAGLAVAVAISPAA